MGIKALRSLSLPGFSFHKHQLSTCSLPGSVLDAAGAVSPSTVAFLPRGTDLWHRGHREDRQAIHTAADHSGEGVQHAGLGDTVSLGQGPRDSLWEADQKAELSEFSSC